MGKGSAGSVGGSIPTAGGELIPPVYDALFPTSAPHPETDVAMSIICGNTHLHWAIHESRSEDYYPSLFWRTTTVPEEDKGLNPIEVLKRFLPNSAQETLFGASTTNELTAGNAAKRAAVKRIPILPVYLITTNPKSEAGVQFILRDMPVMIYRLDGSHFFSPDQGAYHGMGVDRLAAAKAAMSLTGVPTLVIDGGTAMTYTAIDCHGHIVGGGISPGIQVQLSALGEYTGALPTLDADVVKKAVSECKKEKAPLPTFARDTEKAILSSVLSEVAEHVSGVVKSWIATSKPQLEEEKVKYEEEKKVKAAAKEAAEKEAAAAAAAEPEKTPEEEAAAPATNGEEKPADGKEPEAEKPDEAPAAASDAMDVDAPPAAEASAPASDAAPNADKAAGAAPVAETTSTDVNKEKDAATADKAKVVSEAEAVVEEEEKKFNDQMQIVISGGDGSVIADLLKENHSYIVPTMHEMPASTDYSVVYQKHVVHLGVQQLLIENVVPTSAKSQDEQIRDLLIGQRVAKLFRPVKKGNPVTYRGTVASVTRGETSIEQDYYTIVYDDSDREDVGLAELYDLLMFYSSKGENWTERDSHRKTLLERKIDDAKKAANRMAERVPRVKESVAQRHKEAQAAAAAAEAANAAKAAKRASSAQKTGSSKKAKTMPADGPLYDPSADPKSVENVRIAKFFGDNEVYFGTITEYIPAESTDDKVDLWNVTYDDGDVEDFELGEVEQGLDVYRANRAKDPNPK